MNCPLNSIWPSERPEKSFLHRWQKLVAVVMVLTMTGWAGVTNAQIDFDIGVDYITGQQPGGIACGDFDGDNDIDTAVVSDGTTGNDEWIEIFWNNGDGTFTPGPIVNLPNSSSPDEIVAADLDGDMDIDLAVVLRDLQQIQVVTNTGGGVFVLGGTASVGDRAIGMTSGDYDFDFDIDLAVANRNDSTATILTNNGAGVFSSTTLVIAGEPRAVAFVDIEGDVDLDLAVTNNDDRNVALFTNTGGVFSFSTTIPTGPIYRPEGIVAADLDGNGTEDLAVALNDNAQPDQAMVFLNSGGTFGAGTQYPTNGLNTSGILAADFDCDDVLDLVTRNEDSNDLSVLPNLGGGTFGAPTTLSTGLNPSQMYACDLDGDGDNDIGVSNRDSNSFSVFMNNCSPGVTIEICPDTATVTAGMTSSGNSADICDEDSAIWTVQSTTFVAAFSPAPVAITFEGNTNPVGGTDVTLRLVGGPEFGNDAAFIQLRMWNFSTGAYQNTPFINQPDSDNTVYESTNPVADFVGPNGELRAEITCAKTVAGPIRLRMNQVEWQIQ